MKKLLILLLTLFTHFSHAQCILVDLKLSDCVSCRENISILKGLSEKIPVFVIFNESLKADYEDIEYKLSLEKSGIKYVFNNDLFAEYHVSNDESSWCLLNQLGEVINRGSLYELDSAIVTNKIKDLLSDIPQCVNCYNDFTKDYIFEFSHDLNKLRIIDKKNLTNITAIRSQDFDFSILQQALKGADSISFEKAGALLNKKSNRGLKPKFTYFDITSNNEIYLMLEYLQPFVRNDTVSYDIRTAITKYTLSGELKDAFIVNADSTAVHDNLFSYLTLIDDYSFVTVTHDPKNWFESQLKKNPNTTINFITKYNIDTNGKDVIPVSFYSHDLPEIYKKKYFENYLGSELSSYPYITFRYSNEIFNMHDDCTCNILTPNTYWKNVDTSNKELGKEKFTVLGLQALQKDKAVVFYSINNIVYFNTYNKCVLEKTYTVGELYKTDKVKYCYADIYSKQILFRFEKGKIIAIPFEVYDL